VKANRKLGGPVLRETEDGRGQTLIVTGKVDGRGRVQKIAV
jgi:hypothetical protein